MVSIRLKRFGAKKRPYYRIVVVDSHAATTSKTIEEVGFYHPVEAEDKQVQLDKEKIVSWINKGAKPSPTVKKILNTNGITVTVTNQE